jgi:hypothetical protein
MFEKLKDKVQALAADGESILSDSDKLRSSPHWKMASIATSINRQYHAWYNAARPIVEGNLPDTSKEFRALHATASNNVQTLIEPESSAMREDTFNPDDLFQFQQAFASALGILSSVPSAMEARALSLRGLLARDLMDDELAAARHLLNNGYVREAGVIGG